jgi:hypothetical protein
MGAEGYINMDCPTSGTIVYYDASNNITTQTCNSSGVPLSSWESLWYQIVPGQLPFSVQSQYRLVNYQNSLWSPGVGWVLIAARNDDGTNGHVKWTPGQINFPFNSGIYYSGSARTSWANSMRGSFSGANFILS